MAAGGGIALAHCRWSTDICKCQLGQQEAPIGAVDCSWGMECVGALRLEYRHIEVSIRSVGGAYWSWRWQLAEGLRWRTADGALTYANVN